MQRKGGFHQTVATVSEVRGFINQTGVFLIASAVIWRSTPAAKAGIQRVQPIEVKGHRFFTDNNRSNFTTGVIVII